MSDLVSAERHDRDTLTDAELEQEFRDHPITQNERFLLRLLDVERARADVAERAAVAKALREVGFHRRADAIENGADYA